MASPPRILIWVLPDSVAFTHTGGRKSLLGLTRSAAALVRAVAETRAGAAGKKRTSRAILEETSADLFTRAADPLTCTNKPQDHTPDVVVEFNQPEAIDLYFSRMVAPVELERATIFLLRSAFTGARTAGVVASASEFLSWLDDLVKQSRSATPAKEAE